ncbi:hypothetical protein [Mycobacterium sp. 852002-30065_SCH5024008]|uniref:hypothetical protein n=1 Tax=Mycobacterium sp. 852002-30065_SCH5024008 TaxID=1834088 RepID=UPI0012E87336|nr:hypothetical protein [Mycobacterium sp. 852002-30065_SCH5024008]
MAEDQAAMLKQLQADDKNYRDVLSQTASGCRRFCVIIRRRNRLHSQGVGPFGSIGCRDSHRSIRALADNTMNPPGRGAHCHFGSM